jgi:anti-sigma B factor antagonist
VFVEEHLDSVGVTTSGDFDVHSETTAAGAGVVHVSGELDLASAPTLEEAIADLSTDPVVIDLSDCTFLDSAGMRVLLTGARELADAGRTLRVVTADPRILRVLEITAVDTLIAVHPTVDAAL